MFDFFSAKDQKFFLISGFRFFLWFHQFPFEDIVDQLGFDLDQSKNKFFGTEKKNLIKKKKS